MKSNIASERALNGDVARIVSAATPNAKLNSLSSVTPRECPNSAIIKLNSPIWHLDIDAKKARRGLCPNRNNPAQHVNTLPITTSAASTKIQPHS